VRTWRDSQQWCSVWAGRQWARCHSVQWISTAMKHNSKLTCMNPERWYYTMTTTNNQKLNVVIVVIAWPVQAVRLLNHGPAVRNVWLAGTNPVSSQRWSVPQWWGWPGRYLQRQSSEWLDVKLTWQYMTLQSYPWVSWVMWQNTEVESIYRSSTMFDFHLTMQLYCSLLQVRPE